MSEIDKLELLKKSLPMYLNHELKVKQGKKNYAIILDGINFSYQDVDVYSGDETYRLDSIKPYLRPLSDFEKVIAKDLMEKFNCSLSIIQEIWKLIQKEIKLEDVSYKTYLMMCKNHIDFNNLIEKGIAIDINQLDK